MKMPPAQIVQGVGVGCFYCFWGVRGLLSAENVLIDVSNHVPVAVVRCLLLSRRHAGPEEAGVGLF